MNRRQLEVLLGSLLWVTSIGSAIGAEQCSSMTSGSWNDGFATWSINGVEGTLTDQVQSGHMSGCAQYNVTGTLNNGQFTLTATQFNPLGPININCVQTITYTGSLKKPGCHTASGSWTNSHNASGTFTMNTACNVPTGETTQFVGWGGANAYPTSAVFEQRLLPSSFNYGGRTISEAFPTDGTDTCWWVGSSIPKQTKGMVWPSRVLNSDIPTDYEDAVGMDQVRVKYFRDNNRAPCGYTFNQQMFLDCASGATAYKTHTLYLGVEATTVTSTRNGVTVTQPWDSGPPTPQPVSTTVKRAIVNVINVVLLGN